MFYCLRLMDLFNTKKLVVILVCLDRKKQKDGCAVNQIKWDLVTGAQLQVAPNENTQKAQSEGMYVKIKNKGEEHLRSLQQHIWPNSQGLARMRGMSPQKDEVSEKIFELVPIQFTN